MTTREREDAQEWVNAIDHPTAARIAKFVAEQMHQHTVATLMDAMGMMMALVFAEEREMRPGSDPTDGLDELLRYVGERALVHDESRRWGRKK